ncbi:hypothetical protein TRICI_000274 [Trichomonascus ciferrii]|uniref:Uncharacterized protein n=1 Tax=Trichomonascus ciferrii TaxID=44093 RepID=A0A642VDV5_9ASCO|nr:hypothetical protein TRICI_000274 [Trichomonascus ciferrii]
MSEILRAVPGREMTISSVMEYVVSQPQEVIDGKAERLFCESQFQVENIVLIKCYERYLTVNLHDFSPERTLAMIPQVEKRWSESVIRCGCHSADRKIRNLELALHTASQTPERIRDIVIEKVGPGPERERLSNAIKAVRPRIGAIQSYIRHLRGLRPNVQVGPPTRQDYINCFRAIKSRPEHAVEYIFGEPVSGDGIFIRTSSLLGFFTPDNQEIPEHIQLAGHQLKAIFQGERAVVNDELDDVLDNI